MSTGVRRADSAPRMTIRIATTMKVSGRGNTVLTMAMTWRSAGKWVALAGS